MSMAGSRSSKAKVEVVSSSDASGRLEAVVTIPATEVDTLLGGSLDSFEQAFLGGSDESYDLLQAMSSMDGEVSEGLEARALVSFENSLSDSSKLCFLRYIPGTVEAGSDFTLQVRAVLKPDCEPQLRERYEFSCATLLPEPELLDCDAYCKSRSKAGHYHPIALDTSWLSNTVDAPDLELFIEYQVERLTAAGWRAAAPDTITTSLAALKQSRFGMQFLEELTQVGLDQWVQCFFFETGITKESALFCQNFRFRFVRAFEFDEVGHQEAYAALLANKQALASLRQQWRSEVEAALASRALQATLEQLAEDHANITIPYELIEPELLARLRGYLPPSREVDLALFTPQFLEKIIAAVAGEARLGLVMDALGADSLSPKVTTDKKIKEEEADSSLQVSSSSSTEADELVRQRRVIISQIIMPRIAVVDLPKELVTSLEL